MTGQNCTHVRATSGVHFRVILDGLADWQNHSAAVPDVTFSSPWAITPPHTYTQSAISESKTELDDSTTNCKKVVVSSAASKHVSLCDILQVLWEEAIMQRCDDSGSGCNLCRLNKGAVREQSSDTKKHMCSQTADQMSAWNTGERTFAFLKNIL